MKKIVSIVAVLMLLAVSLTLAGCGTKQNQKTDSDYEAYDGYAYYQANGDLKYSLDTKDGLKMHCFFQEGSPEYIEEIYTIDLMTADKQDNMLTVHNVTDGSGNDISIISAGIGKKRLLKKRGLLCLGLAHHHSSI